MAEEMTNLSELAARIEAADASEQRALLIDAAFEIAGDNWPTAKAGQFLRMLDAEAYESAALMLVPEGWAIERLTMWPGKGASCNLYGTHEGPNGERWHNRSDGRVEAEAATPALALVAAALRAKEVSDHG